MFGNGMTEWLVVGVVALIVLGPERLPSLVRMAGRATGKVRGLWADVQRELDGSLPADEVRELAEKFVSCALKPTSSSLFGVWR